MLPYIIIVFSLLFSLLICSLYSNLFVFLCILCCLTFNGKDCKVSGVSALVKVYFTVVDFTGSLSSNIWFQSPETFDMVVVLKLQTLCKLIRRQYFCSISSYDVLNKYLQPFGITCPPPIDPIGQFLHGRGCINGDLCEC